MQTAHWASLKEDKDKTPKSERDCLQYACMSPTRVCPWPASVAQLDARPTGDQEVAGSNPVGSATFFREDLIMKYFLWSFSPFR